MSAPTSSASQRRAPTRGWRRVLFPAAAILLALAPWVALEGTLAVLHGGRHDRTTDPFVGFSRVQPLFELDEDGNVYRTARCRQLFFGRQEFDREKPDRVFRIFGLGGSAVRGRPYETDTSFLQWLEIELTGRDARRRYETVNGGGLSYASYRLAQILDEVLHYQPDLIILATGHNEFLEDRTYRDVKDRPRLLQWTLERLYSLHTVSLAMRLFGRDEQPARFLLDPEVDTRLDHGSGYASYHRDETWRRDVIAHFEHSVRRMIQTCRDAGVPLLLVNLGENLRDCPPFKSEHRPGLSVRQRHRWERLVDQASTQERSDPGEALQIYRQAAAIDDQYALLDFRIARCLDRLGQTRQARIFYHQAKEKDVCPLRMLDEMHRRLKRLAGETGTPLVDAEKLLADASPDGIAGNNCFMDHVHPNLGAHQAIAQQIADRLEEIGLVQSTRPWGPDPRRRAYRRHFQHLGPVYLANGRRRVGWLETWARRNRLDADRAPQDARGHLRLGQKLLDFGELDAAWASFQKALHEDPQTVQPLVEHAERLFQQGRGALAGQLLDRLVKLPQAAGLGAEIHAIQSAIAGDRPQAARRQQALPPNPAPENRQPVTRDAALQTLDAAIQRHPDRAHLYLARGRLHLAQRDFHAAVADASQAIQLAPENAEASSSGPPSTPSSENSNWPSPTSPTQPASTRMTPTSSCSGATRTSNWANQTRPRRISSEPGRCVPPATDPRGRFGHQDGRSREWNRMR